MNIINPPRIASLESQSIRVHVHRSGGTKTSTMTVYPFDTVLVLKQRICAHLGGGKDRALLPGYQFLAVPGAKKGHWRPVEFRWPFEASDLPDPLASRGVVDARLMEGDVRKLVFPTRLAGFTVDALDLGGELHVWSLVDFVADLDMTPAVFGGYIQLYFPLLKTPTEAVYAGHTTTLTEREVETVRALETFLHDRDARLQLLDSKMVSLSGEGSVLRDLHALRFVLPTRKLSDTLDILFYEMTPTRANPILRYFAPNSRAPPLLKLATGPTGIPLLTDISLLKLLLADEPSAEMGSMLVLKAPLASPAPTGATWTLRMYEDGGADLFLAAPRRDKPLSRADIEAALRLIPSFLAGTPWKDLTDARLTELTATYEYTTQTEMRKPTADELRKRAPIFQTLFQVESPIVGTQGIPLRWRAVTNFDTDQDPITRYITNMYMATSARSAEALSIPTYVEALVREFGVSEVEASEALNTWLHKQAEYVVADPDHPEKAVAAHNMGVGVHIVNYHPRYQFRMTDIQSERDLRLVLTLLEVWVSFSARDLIGAQDTAPGPVAAEEPTGVPEQPAPPEEAPVEGNVMAEWADAMNMYDMYGLQEEVDPAEVVQDAAASPPKAPPTALPAPPLMEEPTNIRYPEPLRPDEAPLSSVKDYILDQLKQRNLPLFKFTSEKPYSRTCQSNANKQPNVMSPESYARIRALYGAEDVHWLEAPLSEYDNEAVTTAYRMVNERKKLIKEKGKTWEQIVALEMRALELGVPIKDGKSILTVWKEGPGLTDEMKGLMAAQAAKPLWVVVRTGTGADKPNYYICAEYWCVRDDLPLREMDFVGTRTRSGAPKAANTCPFCAGSIIQNPAAPKAGETVLRRGPSSPGGAPVAKYAGFLKGLFHPQQFPLPCCFVDPDNLSPPEGAAPVPAPRVPLPDNQQVERDGRGPQAAETEAGPGAIDAEQEGTSVLMSVFSDVNIKMDYTPARFKFLTEDPSAADTYKFLNKEKTKIQITGKRILRTYILEANSFPLDLGKVGILPPAVDAFLGQDRKQYLDKHGDIYTHPEVGARAFFRLGLGVKPHNAGLMILQLIAFAVSAVSHILPTPTLRPPTPEELLGEMFGTREVEMFHAFQQANYGTLPLQFADPARPLLDGDFKAWCARVGIPLPQQRAHAEFLYRAWMNFQAYVRDTSAPKDLGLWEHLLATPGLFTPTGVLLARLTQTGDGGVTLHCPAFGITPRDQGAPTPIVFVYEDRRLRLCEPLLFLQGPNILLGAFTPSRDSLGQLHPSVREPLLAFYEEFKRPRLGCGRPKPPVHPWRAEVGRQATLVRLGPVLRALASLQQMPAKLLRDRTRRLVGVLVSVGNGDSATMALIPCVDDGTVIIDLPTVYDVEGFQPLASLSDVLDILMGDGTASNKGLVRFFPELTPVQILFDTAGPKGEAQRVALQTRAGFPIPFAPLPLDAVVKHPAFLALRGATDVQTALPWKEDQRILGTLEDLDPQERVAALSVLRNPEEAFGEAYQHLRLSFGNWLGRTAEGRALRKEIEALRSGAHAHLPLYERRKRMDLLLFPVIRQWIHVGTEVAEEPIEILRRDCLTLKSAQQCTGSCAWVRGDTCLIHAVPTERSLDPVFVMTARLGDELLRTYGDAQHILTSSVPRLQPPRGLKRERGAVIAAVGAEQDDFFAAVGLKDRLPTRYTQGLVVPEEVGEEDVGYEATYRGIPLTWVNLTHMVWGAEQSRDPKQQMELFWTAFAEKPWDTLKPLFAQGLTGETLQAMADTRGVHILTTRDGPSGYELVDWFAPSNPMENGVERRFLLLDPTSSPLISTKTREPVLKESELSSAIRQWLDGQAAVEPDHVSSRDVHANLVVEEAGEEDVFPYTLIPRSRPASLPPQEKPAQKPAAPAGPVAQPRGPKPCKEGEERSPLSKKCVKVCKEGLIRDESTGRCVTPKRLVAPVKPVAPKEPAGQEPAAAPRGPKPCKEGEERSPLSKKCVKVCKEGLVRDESTGRCVTPKRLAAAVKPKEPEVVEGPKEPAAAPARGPKPCKEGEERSPISKKCVKICKEGLVRDPITGRCVTRRKKRATPNTNKNLPRIRIEEA